MGRTNTKRESVNMKKINTIIMLAVFNVLIITSHIHAKNSNELYEKIDLYCPIYCGFKVI